MPGAAAAVRGLVAFSFLLLAGAVVPHAATGQEGARVVAAPGAPMVVDQETLGGMSYRSIGPSRGGRVTAVAGHPAHPSTFYMGSTGGGIWKTTDRGQNWYNISDAYPGSNRIPMSIKSAYR